MNILYLATFDPTSKATGTATRGRLFLEYLSDHFSVHLVHLSERDEEGRSEKITEKISSIHRVEYTRFGYFFWSDALYSTAAETLSNIECSVIFADFEKAGYYAKNLSETFNIPYIYNSHNVEYLRYTNLLQRNILRLPFIPYMYWLERSACKGATCVISISRPDAKYLQGWVDESDLYVMPCCFDEDVYNPFYEEKSREEEVILLVGNYRNIGSRQAAELLVEEIRPQVIQERKKVAFRCVGKHFPEELKVENVEAPGFVDDLAEEYRRASLVVAPVQMGGGIKIKVVEALACGKPLVATEKALEGIDVDRLSNMEVTRVEEFADVILSMLEEGREKTTDNWSYIKDGFGNQSQLNRIRKLVEEVGRTHE